MKWKNKVTGWTAQSEYYSYPTSAIKCKYTNGEKNVEFNIPYQLIQADENWEEIPDGRWLDYQMSAREFMEAFAMTITDGACGHDSYVVKRKIDKSLGLIKENCRKIPSLCLQYAYIRKAL